MRRKRLKRDAITFAAFQEQPHAVANREPAIEQFSCTSARRVPWLDVKQWWENQRRICGGRGNERRAGSGLDAVAHLRSRRSRQPNLATQDSARGAVDRTRRRSPKIPLAFGKQPTSSPKPSSAASLRPDTASGEAAGDSAGDEHIPQREGLRPPEPPPKFLTQELRSGENTR